MPQNPETPKSSEDKKDDEPAPKGNGGKTDKYVWTQTLEELNMYVPIPAGVNKAGLVVKITVDSLLVQVKGQDPIINGKFYERINSEDSIWTI